MEEMLKDVLSVFTLSSVLFTLAVMAVASRLVTRDPAGKLPKSFVLIPTLAAFGFGIVSYFYDHTTAELAQLTVGRRVLEAFVHGVIAFISSAIIFEFRKPVIKAIKKRLGIAETEGPDDIIDTGTPPAPNGPGDGKPS